MQSYETIDRSAVKPQATPLFARLVSKLVLEVLPAALASVIGAVLIAHYQFGHPSVSAGGMAAAAPAPASPEMLQLVRDEHDLIRNFINAQQAAQADRYATADAQSVEAAADAEPAVAAAPRAANAAAAKAPAPRVKPAAIAPLAAAPTPAPAAAPAVVPAPQALPAVAGLQNSAAPPGPPPAAPEHPSLMARLLAVKDNVVRAPLHAVMSIGGIPSWIGRQLGSEEPDPSEQMFSAAS